MKKQTNKQAKTLSGNENIVRLTEKQNNFLKAQPTF